MSIDVNAIKTSIKNILDTANTTTASVDLSSNFANSNTRVQRVLKLNPNKIPPQASLFPLVTMYFDDKNIVLKDISRNQANSRREARFTLNIMGGFWNNNFSNIAEDPADEDVENLMENIEQILRNEYQLSNTADWSFPRSVTYHSSPIDEKTHLRFAIMKYEIVKYY